MIIYLEIRNFMTFDHLVCKPGSRLNLVIGPNGSGKSSLVCTIGLALGGEPQLLGRAATVGAFVKRGEESGYTKITLRGRTVSKKEITEIIQKFNIQVNNLTQFLPQDRVCEFAKLSPVRLVLEETEKAVGDPQLPVLHRDHVDISAELQRSEQVKNTNVEEGVEGADEDEDDETELVDHLQFEEDEVKEFFKKLDEELDKVNQFYINKESEFLERGEMLNKQLQILLDLQQLLDCRRRSSRCNSPASLGFLRSYSSETASEFGEETVQTDDVISAQEKNGINLIGAATRGKTKKGKPKTSMRIDIPATTPARTITAVTSMLWEDLVNNPKKQGDYVSRKKLQCAEKMIKGAFVELYRGLGLLKKYSSLNMVAFVKILKKFDKVSNQQSSANYLKVE